MAMGFRSFLGIWIGGLAVGVTPPAVLCPCPEWGHDQTITDQFANVQTLVNAFDKEQSLTNGFITKDEQLGCTYTNIQTLANVWGRKGCD